MSAPVFVLGRFPPPADGQTLATERCAAFLDEAFDVRRLDTQAPGPDPLTAHPRFDLARARHYLGLRRRLAEALGRAPAAPVLWQAVSPAPWGHLRDVLATVPALAPSQPLVAVVHRAGFEALSGSALTAWTSRRLVRRVDAFVFLSRALADRSASVVPEAKIRVVPNTVREALLPSADAVVERRSRGPGTPLQVLFLSNLMPEKGFADVLEALGLLRQRGVAAELTVAGRWPGDAARAAFEARANALRVTARLTGPVSAADDVARLHLAADVFALPTTHPTESQPVSVLEALAAGTPVVSTDRPILRDILTDGVEGALVRPHDPAALAEALRALTDPSRWRAASAAARARFDRAFHPDVVGARWRDLAAEWTTRG